MYALCDTDVIHSYFSISVLSIFVNLISLIIHVSIVVKTLYWNGKLTTISEEV